MTRNTLLSVLSGIFLSLVLSALPAQQVAAPGAAASVGEAQVVFQPQVLAGAGMAGFPDGNLSYRWPPLVGRANPILYGSASGQMARLDIPSVAQKCPPVKGLPGKYRYAAGGGAVLTNPLDGKWLACIHCETATPQSPQFFWGTLAWVVSPDFGQTWAWLGEFVQPAMPYSDPLRAVCEIGGGPVAFKGEYLLCYLRETTASGAGRQGVAYAKAQDVFAAAVSGQVAPWKKWSGGGFPNAQDPPAVGGGQCAQLPGLPNESDWADVKWVGDRGLFLGAVCPFATKTITLYTSPDGLSWAAKGGPVTTDGGFKYYPSLVGQNPDERFVMMDPYGGVWLYYLVSQKDPFDWSGSAVRRRLVRF